MIRNILALSDPPGLGAKVTAKQLPILKKYYLQHGYNLIKRKYPLSDLGFDPVSVATVLTGIYNAAAGLFGGSRKALTGSDWLQIIPGSGYWHEKLRNYMALHIQYNTDLKNIEPFTAYFADDNKISINDLNNYLSKESGSSSSAGFDFSLSNPLVIVGAVLIGGLVLSSGTATKKRR